MKDELNAIYEVSNSLVRYHIPFYSLDKYQQPIGIGSGVLVDFYGHKFIATAAHVFDTFEKNMLFLGLEKEVLPLPLGLEVIETGVDIARNNDDIDLCLIFIDKSLEKKLSYYSYITINYDNLNVEAFSENNRYHFIGYPATKNKTKFGTNIIRRQIFSYGAYEVDSDTYKILGVNRITHIAINFKKNGSLQVPTGTIANVPDVYGMSGGGVWLERESEQHRFIGNAVAWKKKEKCLVGTRAGFLVANLLKHL